MTFTQQLLGMIIIFGSAVIGALFMGAWQVGIIVGLIALCAVAFITAPPATEADTLHQH